MERRFRFDPGTNEWCPVERIPLAYHQAGRIEFLNPGEFLDRLSRRQGDLTIRFRVESKEIFRIDERRWNVVHHCRILAQNPTPALWVR